MPVEITMPQLSDTMTEGTVVKWLKKEVDKVKAGEVIAEVETDKATMETESFEGGTLAYAVAEGTKVPVGGIIAVLATGKDDPAEVKKKYAGGGKAAVASASHAPAPAPVPGAHPGILQASNSEVHEPDNQLHGATREQIATEPPKGEKSDDDRIRVSPLAKKIAAERGVDLSSIKGSGPGGRIVKQDVFDAKPASAQVPQKVEARSLQPSAPSTGANVPAQVAPARQRIGAGQSEIIPLSKIRQVIANRLQQSKQNIPHFYETVDVDVEDLTKLRARLNEQLAPQKIKLSLGDLVAKAIASALEEHPALNAHFNGKEITRFGDVNLGMAVALPEGLIVPVLRGVNHMQLREIRVRSADLVDRARAQRLKQDEMTGATFTVSNLGMFGVREFSAIINPPEVGILAIGGAEKRAVVRNDQIVARHMMTLTLSCDHRAVDGATAAEFLTTLRQLLEEPGLMLV